MTNEKFRVPPNHHSHNDSTLLSTSQNLADLNIVINQHDSNRRLLHNDTNSQRHINSPAHQQLLSSNHPSSTPYSYNGNPVTNSRREIGVHLSTELDANHKVLSDIKSILSNITLETYNESQKKLEALEIDRYERLEGMISIIFLLHVVPLPF